MPGQEPFDVAAGADPLAIPPNRIGGPALDPKDLLADAVADAVEDAVAAGLSKPEAHKAVQVGEWRGLRWDDAEPAESVEIVVVRPDGGGPAEISGSLGGGPIPFSAPEHAAADDER